MREGQVAGAVRVHFFVQLHGPCAISCSCRWGEYMSGLHTKRMCTVSSISHSVVLPWEGEPNAKIVQL